MCLVVWMHDHGSFGSQNWNKQLRNDKALSAVADSKVTLKHSKNKERKSIFSTCHKCHTHADTNLVYVQEPHPPSVAKPSHLVGAGLGFNPQYRVKRREIDPRLLEKSPYVWASSSVQLLPDAEKSAAIRHVQQKILSAEPGVS